MVFWYFLIIIALIWIIFATITDIKKREVPDWLNYSLIAIGLGSRLIYSFILNNYSYILYGLIGFIIAFAIANLMYYTKQWGGGDSKLLMGLGAMFGSYQSIEIVNSLNKLPFLATLLINIFIAGAFYGLFYCSYLGIKNKKQFLIEFKKQNFKYLKIISLALLLLIIPSIVLFNYPLSLIISILLIFLLISLFSIYIIRIIENISFYKMIDINMLTPGDWLVNDIVKNKKIICKTRNIGLTKEDILNLKKNKIKKVLIKEGIPFVPSFLLGFIISIIFGDIILMLI